MINTDFPYKGGVLVNTALPNKRGFLIKEGGGDSTYLYPLHAWLLKYVS